MPDPTPPRDSICPDRQRHFRWFAVWTWLWVLWHPNYGMSVYHPPEQGIDRLHQVCITMHKLSQEDHSIKTCSWVFVSAVEVAYLAVCLICTCRFRMVTTAMGPVATGRIGERYDKAILVTLSHHREPGFQVSRACPTSSQSALVLPLRLA